MRRLSPADELAEIRAEIARLRQREATLEATILRNPVGCARGTFNMAEVTENRCAVFDPALLPPEMQADPRFWREEVTHQVAVIPTRPQKLSLRPGWPIRRAPQSLLPFH
jgi:hypothetical protein